MDIRLYPRLFSRGRLNLLFETATSAPLDELVERASFEDETTIFAATGASRISIDELQRLRDVMVRIAVEHGFPTPMSQEAALVFDRHLAVHLFRASMLFPAEAAVPGVWSFLALVLAPDITRWRNDSSKSTGQAPSRERYVCADLTRHTHARLWWRAYLLGGADKPDGELLADLGRLGESDFDQIQSRRVAYGGSPYVFEGIVRFWSDHVASGRISSIAATTDSQNIRELFRDFLIQTSRRGAFVQFEALTSQQLNRHFEASLSAAVAYLGGQVNP